MVEDRAGAEHHQAARSGGAERDRRLRGMVEDRTSARSPPGGAERDRRTAGMVEDRAAAERHQAARSDGAERDRRLRGMVEDRTGARSPPGGPAAAMLSTIAEARARRRRLARSC